MCTILIIEDNEEIRENTAELLTLNKFLVLTAENGKTGFETAKKNLPDLILCDMMMPDTDGQRFLELARTNEMVRRIPIVFFSAGTPSLWIQKRLVDEAKGFLKKPFLEQELLNVIECALAN